MQRAIKKSSAGRPLNGLPEPRTWTSADGKFTVEATFIKYIAGQVHLDANGREIVVPAEKLSEGDRKWLLDRGR
jgi:hypothetical protein